MQLPQVVPTPVQRSMDDASLIGVMLEQQTLMLEREEKMRQEMRQMAQSVADLKLRESSLREHATATALRDQQLLALQSRLGSVHAAKLLRDEELYKLEDLIEDSLAAEEGGDAGEGGGRLVAKLVALSERTPGDAALARQLRRKYA